MAKKHLFSIALLIALSLSSCGENIEKVYINKNGELYSLDEVNDNNAYKIGSFEYIDNLIEKEESFIFYFMQNNCQSCEEFKDVMLSYVKETLSFVVKVNLSEQNDLAYKLHEKYSSTLLLEDTPRVYLIESKENMTLIPQSMYSSSLLFNKAMNDRLTTSNVYTFSTLESYKSFFEKEDDLLTIFLDSYDSSANKRYKEIIKDVIQNSDKKTALVELDSNNLEQFKKEYSLTDLSSPIGYRKKDNKWHTFSLNNKESSDFLATYLN